MGAERWAVCQQTTRASHVSEEDGVGSEGGEDEGSEGGEDEEEVKKKWTYTCFVADKNNHFCCVADKNNHFFKGQ